MAHRYVFEHVSAFVCTFYETFVELLDPAEEVLPPRYVREKSLDTCPLVVEIFDLLGETLDAGGGG